VRDITATEAKNKFGDVLHEVLSNKEEFMVKRNGRDVAVIIPVKEYMAFQMQGQVDELLEKGAE
jgi:prevent-host-death family protein